MKKSIVSKLLFICIILNFSYSIDLETTMDYSEPADFFDKVEEYYDSNIGEYYNKWYDMIANKYWTDVWTIKWILAWKLTKCIKIFPIMWIKWPKYSEDDFLNCQATIKKNLDDYVKTETYNKAIEDSTAWENTLSDWIEDNWPFDLLADINTMSKILFKEEITFDDIAFEQEKNNSNWWGWGSAWGWSGSWSWSGWTNWWNNWNNNNWWNWGNNRNDESNNNWNNNNWWNSDNNKNSNNTWNNENKTEYINKNLQFWNICTSNFNNQWNNWNNNNWWNWGNNRNDDWFNTFTWWWDLGWFIWWWGWNWGYYWSWWWYGLGWWDGWMFAEIWALEEEQWVCPPEDYILAICVTLVPSGPRWPVWWTVYKRSIFEILEKTNDVLREMKDENYISQARHWDESLDIDYQHINLSDHFAIDIVLSKKPVFDFKRRKDKEKEKNLADTNWEGVPRKFAKMYHENWIWDPFDKENDKNKYLISNTEYVKPDRKVENNYEEKVNNTSSKWMFKIMERHSDYVNWLNKINDSLIEITKKIKKTAELLSAKSKVR